MTWEVKATSPTQFALDLPRFGTVSFLNTLTVFGTPSDVTLAELALEMLFPADDETIEIVAEMERERSPVGSPVLRKVQQGPRA